MEVLDCPFLTMLQPRDLRRIWMEWQHTGRTPHVGVCLCENQMMQVQTTQILDENAMLWTQLAHYDTKHQILWEQVALLWDENTTTGTCCNSIPESTVSPPDYFNGDTNNLGVFSTNIAGCFFSAYSGLHPNGTEHNMVKLWHFPTGRLFYFFMTPPCLFGGRSPAKAKARTEAACLHHHPILQFGTNTNEVTQLYQFQGRSHEEMQGWE